MSPKGERPVDPRGGSEDRSGGKVNKKKNLGKRGGWASVTTQRSKQEIPGPLKAKRGNAKRTFNGRRVQSNKGGPRFFAATTVELGGDIGGKEKHS